MPISIEQAPDLRKVYLLAFDSFSLHGASSVADAFPEINTRYARELLGALVRGNMLILDTDSDGGDMWQVNDPGTYDNHSRVEAEEAIDKWLGVQPPPDPQSATSPAGPHTSSAKSATREPHQCLCGCSEVITTRALYRPGHDARHAGQVGRQVAREVMETGGGVADLETDADRFAVLPSDALKTKALRIANKELSTLTRQGKNTKPEPEPHYIEGIIKVGKTEFPGRKWPTANGENEQYEYLSAKGWVAASKTAAKTFQEG